MKIPETTANVGAYYGNEENGQWQPNGVIIDSGVGGGVVGSGDAGIHRPPVYPVHLPRGHMPGYVMAGAYYPPAPFPPVAAPAQDDFADYMWMENEEEFDKQVMQQLEEEALMEQCIEAMLEDEQRERHDHRPTANGHKHHAHYPTTSNGPSLSLEETVSRSTLNPLAAEFVPTRARAPATEEKQEPSVEVTPSSEEVPQNTQDGPVEHTSQPDTHQVEEDKTKTEEPVPPQKDPPEVSAADVQPIDKSQRAPSKDKKDSPKAKPDPKKTTKTDVKPKPKAQPVKSETKVQPKKKDVKSVKSETRPEEDYRGEEGSGTTGTHQQPQPTPVEESQPPSGFKPINYAAAAKANKPKPKPTTPTTDKQQPTPQPQPTTKTEKSKTEKKDKLKTEKPLPKTEKVNVQRKNSAK